MKKHVLLISFLFLIILVLAGCGAVNKNGLFLTEDSPKEVTVSAGENFTVVLNENPSTGYSWHYQNDNKDAVALEGEDFVSSADKGVVGAGGKHFWRFKALNKGTAKLTFKYYREWEKDKIEQSYTYTVTVK